MRSEDGIEKAIEEIVAFVASLVITIAMFGIVLIVVNITGG